MIVIIITTYLIILIFSLSMVGLVIGADKLKTNDEKKYEDQEQIEWIDKNCKKLNKD